MPNSFYYNLKVYILYVIWLYNLISMYSLTMSPTTLLLIPANPETPVFWLVPKFHFYYLYVFFPPKEELHGLLLTALSFSPSFQSLLHSVPNLVSFIPAPFFFPLPLITNIYVHVCVSIHTYIYAYI